MRDPPRDVTLRAEAAGEADDVRRLVIEAFDDPVLGDLLGSLRASRAWIDGLSYVAESNGALVGQVLFTQSLLDAPKRLVDVLVLSPLGVLPAYQGRGIGSALVRYGLEQVHERPAGVRRGLACVLLALGFRSRRAPRAPSSVPADPSGGVPGDEAAVVRALDDGHACVRRAVVAARLRWPAWLSPSSRHKIRL